MISSVDGYLRYFEGIRRRTYFFALSVPAEHFDWSPARNDFTCGDILRHIAAIEQISVYAVVNGRWQPYPGHERELAPDLKSAINYLGEIHIESKRLLRRLPDEVLIQQRTGLDGTHLKAWRLLMAMIEHEIHHRSQLGSYLAMIGVKPPQLYGLGVEDVEMMSKMLS